MLDVVETEVRLGASMAAIRTRRDVLEVAGPDAGDYLHGQVSQDVLGLAVGASAGTLLLQPQGKIDARLRLSRLDETRYWLDVEPGFGELALERLQRFKLRVDAELTLSTLDMVAIRGPEVAGLVGDRRPEAPDGGAVLDALWPGVDGLDIIGDGAEVPAGIAEGPADALDALRISLGIPAMGRELTSSTIPAAAGIVEQTVDFTKGCYVGQELVARVDSRGNNTPTRLRSVTFIGDADEATPPEGSQIEAGDEVVGELTSVAGSHGGRIGLAYVKRAVEPPAEAEIVGVDGTRFAVTVAELPSSRH